MINLVWLGFAVWLMVMIWRVDSRAPPGVQRVPAPPTMSSAQSGH